MASLPHQPSLVLLNQGCSWQLDGFQAWRGKGGAGGASCPVLNIWSVSCLCYSRPPHACFFTVCKINTSDVYDSYLNPVLFEPQAWRSFSNEVCWVIHSHLPCCLPPCCCSSAPRLLLPAAAVSSLRKRSYTVSSSNSVSSGGSLLFKSEACCATREGSTSINKPIAPTGIFHYTVVRQGSREVGESWCH